VIHAYHGQDPRIGLVSLSRNFGKEIALTAGIDHAKWRAVVVIDADLQDPPELIPDLVARWEEGYDVVYAHRTAREGETNLKRLTAHMFYRIINQVADQPIPADVGDFRLMSRRACRPGPDRLQLGPSLDLLPPAHALAPVLRASLTAFDPLAQTRPAVARPAPARRAARP
jgi:glycosyltransferase involved in cell wall biosynthesis